MRLALPRVSSCVSPFDSCLALPRVNHLRLHSRLCLRLCIFVPRPASSLASRLAPRIIVRFPFRFAPRPASASFVCVYICVRVRTTSYLAPCLPFAFSLVRVPSAYLPYPIRALPHSYNCYPFSALLPRLSYLSSVFSRDPPLLLILLFLFLFIFTSTVLGDLKLIARIALHRSLPCSPHA